MESEGGREREGENATKTERQLLCPSPPQIAEDQARTTDSCNASSCHQAAGMFDMESTAAAAQDPLRGSESERV